VYRIGIRPSCVLLFASGQVSGAWSDEETAVTQWEDSHFWVNDAFQLWRTAGPPRTQCQTGTPYAIRTPSAPWPTPRAMRPSLSGPVSPTGHRADPVIALPLPPISHTTRRPSLNPGAARRLLATFGMDTTPPHCGDHRRPALKRSPELRHPRAFVSVARQILRRKCHVRAARGGVMLWCSAGSGIRHGRP
jgi:hypothetical protein